MNTEEIREAFRLLRDLCDARGHPLLDTLEHLCLVESASLELLLCACKPLISETHSNVIPLIRDYSVKA